MLRHTRKGQRRRLRRPSGITAGEREFIGGSYSKINVLTKSFMLIILVEDLIEMNTSNDGLELLHLIYKRERLLLHVSSSAHGGFFSVKNPKNLLFRVRNTSLLEPVVYCKTVFNNEWSSNMFS